MNDTIIQERFEKFLSKAKLKHGDKFTYDRTTWNGMTHPMSMVCPDHGDFQKKPGLHLVQKYSCPGCDAETKGKWNTKPRDIYFSELQAIHSGLYRYNPEQYVNTGSILDITCQTHGDFKQTAGAHWGGQGCPECGKWKAGATRSVKFDEFVARARAKHGDKFEYDNDSYSGMEQLTKIECHDHGVFEQKSYDHIESTHGCPYCSLIESGLKRRRSDDSMMNELITAQPEHDYVRLYRDASHNNKPMLEINCPEHGVYVKGYHKLLRHGGGCPDCNHSRQYSKMERDWLISLNIPTLVYQYRLPDNLVVDGYDPVTNTVYQFHGDFWHGNPDKFDPLDINPKTKVTFGDAYKKTLVIAEQIRSQGFYLVEKWQTELEQ